MFYFIQRAAIIQLSTFISKSSRTACLVFYGVAAQWAATARQLEVDIKKSLTFCRFFPLDHARQLSGSSHPLCSKNYIPIIIFTLRSESSRTASVSGILRGRRTMGGCCPTIGQHRLAEKICKKSRIFFSINCQASFASLPLSILQRTVIVLGGKYEILLKKKSYNVHIAF